MSAPAEHCVCGRPVEGHYAEQFDTLLRLASAGHDMSSAITMMDATVLYAIGLRTEPKLAQQVFFIGLAFFNPEYRNEAAT